MQRVMGQARRAIQEYGMIAPGDHVAAAVSGGKDSLAMLAALARLRRILPGGFTLTALSLEMGFPGGAADWEPVRGLCNALEVPFELRQTQIGEIVFFPSGRRKIPARYAPGCGAARCSTRRGRSAAAGSPSGITATTRWRPF